MNNDVIKILLVEADQTQYLSIKQLLKTSPHPQFELDWIEKFEIALEQMVLNQHDICLIDYDLGQGKIGTELIQLAIEQGCQAPMILLTANDSEEVELATVESGTADFLAKDTLTAHLLLRGIRYALEHQKDTRSRQKAEAEARYQANILEAIFNSIGDGVIVADEDGNFLIENPASQKILGKTLNSLEGYVEKQEVFYAHGETPVPRGELPLERALQGIPSEQVELLVRNTNNPGGVYISSTASPIEWDNGVRKGAVSVFRDITQRKIADEALQDAFRTIRAQQELVSAEMEQARETQKVILPENLPEIHGIQLASKHLSMDQIGGDFYDVFSIPDDQIGIMVADVTGHGVPAALLSLMISNVFNDIVSQVVSTQLVLEMANTALEEKLPEGKFATMFFAIYDLHSKTLTYTCGGHPPAYVIRCETEEILALDTEGMAVGMFPSILAEYEEKQIQLIPGDKVLFYTDAIIEVVNEENQQFGFNNFKNFLKQSSHLPIQKLLDEIYQYGFEYSNFQGFGDDITLVGLEISE